MSSRDDAYKMGLDAARQGLQLGTNPFDPEFEPVAYDSWEDGWSFVDTSNQPSTKNSEQEK